MKPRIIIMIFAAVLALCLAQTTALATDTSPADGYNDYDEMALQTFLSQNSAVAGQTNAQVLGYDPVDPSTWTDVTWDPSSGENCLAGINWVNKSLAGTLNVSGCTSLIAAFFDQNSITSINAGGCTALTDLTCNQNALTSLNITGLGSLSRVECFQNQMTSLDLSGCGALTILSCSNNNISSLNLSGLSLLTELYCGSNDITSLSLSGFGNLRTVECSSSALISLDLSGCSALRSLTCSQNHITSLNLNGLTSLVEVYCELNDITTLDAAGLSNLVSLYCNNNKLTSLSVTGCSALQYLHCENNSLTVLDAGDLGHLTELACLNNALTSLNVNGCNHLRSLVCSSNSLTSLNVNGLPVLEKLYCTQNKMTALDISGCSHLNWLECGKNQLSSLKLNGSVMNVLECPENQLTTLDLSTCLNLYRVDCTGNKLTSLDLSSANIMLAELDCIGNPLTQIKAVISGGNINITRVGGGTVSLYRSDSSGEFYATAAATSPVSFLNWIAGSSQAGANNRIDLTTGNSYSLTANFTAIVTFDSGGGSAAESLVVLPGGKILRPQDPTRSGYVFGGWYKDVNCKILWDFANDTVSDNITLYAKWTSVSEPTTMVTPGNAVVYVGGRIKLTPSVPGGNWNWDNEFLDVTKNSDGSVIIKGLKAGNTTVYYSIGYASAEIPVEIRVSALPQTGQDFSSVYGMLALAGCAMAAAVIVAFFKNTKDINQK